MGVKGNSLIFTYTKPCYGTFVLTVDSEDSTKEIDRLRETEKNKVKPSLKKSKPPESPKAPSGSYLDMWKK